MLLLLLICHAAFCRIIVCLIISFPMCVPQQLGVLEWVSNTTPLKCIISEEMGKDDALCAANPQACTTSNGVREVELMALHAFEARKKFVYDSYDHQAFHRMFKSASREQATDVYNSITATLPSDYIRRRFQSIALTAEAFVTIRSEFAKTLAVSSLFGYILGKYCAIGKYVAASRSIPASPANDNSLLIHIYSCQVTLSPCCNLYHLYTT